MASKWVVGRRRTTALGCCVCACLGLVLGWRQGAEAKAKACRCLCRRGCCPARAALSTLACRSQLHRCTLPHVHVHVRRSVLIVSMHAKAACVEGHAACGSAPRASVPRASLPAKDPHECLKCGLCSHAASASTHAPWPTCCLLFISWHLRPPPPLRSAGVLWGQPWGQHFGWQHGSCTAPPAPPLAARRRAAHPAGSPAGGGGGHSLPGVAGRPRRQRSGAQGGAAGAAGGRQVGKGEGGGGSRRGHGKALSFPTAA